MRFDNSRTRLYAVRLTKSERESEMFVPNERNANAEALICLNSPLPECNKIKCKRFDEELQKIKGGEQ